MRYWINTVSKDHVMVGKENRIVQASHGKKAPLQRMRKNDAVIFYSPKTSLKEGEVLQAFTAIAVLKDGRIFQVEIDENFKPFRRDARYLPCMEVSIRPLINDLQFIENKKSWGFKFRFGLFEINQHDFNLIARQMKVDTNNIKPDF